MSTALALARHVHAMASAPMADSTREAALRCVLDLAGSVAMGFGESSARAAREACPRVHGAGASAIWFSGETASPAAALFANATAAAALDVDDGVRIARGHPGAAVIPAAWAALEPEATDGERFLRAVVAGYEAAVRFSLARLAFTPSGTWSPYGAIAAAAIVRGLGPEAMANAFGIAAQGAPAMAGLAGRFGSDVKEGIPFGAVAGLLALELSAAGFTGPAHIFDERTHFDASRVFEGRDGPPLIEEAYFKPYACCRHLHAPIDAYEALAASHGFAAADVAAVEVHTYKGTFNLSNKPAPQTMVEAQYSVPYCLALFALRGPAALLPMDEGLLHDPGVIELAHRISLHPDADIEKLFPARSPARVTVLLRSGARLASPVTDPKGDPCRPLSTAELEAKFTMGTRHALDAPRQQAVLAAVDPLRAGRLRPLAHAIAAAAGVGP